VYVSVYIIRADRAVHSALVCPQVHRAVLRATGEEVVVKVQHPGIEALMKQDLINMERIVRCVRIPIHTDSQRRCDAESHSFVCMCPVVLLHVSFITVVFHFHFRRCAAF
jgi:hypothetical protein